MNHVSRRTYGRLLCLNKGLRQVRHDMQKPTAEVLALVDPAVGCEAFGRHRGLGCGRSSLGGRRVNLRLPPATSRMGGRAAGATCSV